jgi:hypothetical protein
MNGRRVIACRLTVDQWRAVQAIQPAYSDGIPAIDTRSTTEEAIGLGRTGDRNVNVPNGLPDVAPESAGHVVLDASNTGPRCEDRRRGLPGPFRHSGPDGSPRLGQMSRVAHGVRIWPTKQTPASN